tara:strand:- start:361 stop:1131 length:771 start_codon:yes stop_codon:yes gene_type:complete
MEKQPQFPAEEVTLPSKGLLYPEGSPLRSGKIEMKYMTAREEDILTNQNFIKNGTAIDKLLKSLIVTPGFNYDDLLIGDKNALMVAARILGYGAEYEIKRTHPETGIESTGVINLSNIKDKEINEKLIIDGKNEFDFTLPTAKINITFKLLTQKDENNIQREIDGLKKINNASSSEGTVRLKHIILSIDKDYELKTIRNFVDNQLLAKDARALRQYITQIQPGINPNTEVEFNDGYIEENIDLPINLSFFWPDAGV